MSQSGVQVRLRWIDPVTGDPISPTLQMPIALGRDFQAMPSQLESGRVSRMVLNSRQVAPVQALLVPEPHGGVQLLTPATAPAPITRVNGQPQSQCSLANGDILQLGPYEISVAFVQATPPPVASTSPEFDPTQLPALAADVTALPFTPPPSRTIIPFGEAPPLAPPAPTPALPPVPDSPASAFPPDCFQQPVLTLADLHQTGLAVQETTYAAIGAGLGSFIWINVLRLSGVPAPQIQAIGLEAVPYARYQRLCANSQIPARERLRSNSDSCPDNIWGWPSYAWREAGRELGRGQLLASLRLLWRVFAEPDLAETYTPQAGNVFAALDREAARIGWSEMYHYGRVRAIRQVEDGRYAIALSRSSSNQRDHAIVLAPYVHLATGYPAIQFLPDLQTYREQTQDFQAVVNAYEPHEHVYRQLEAQGGTVMLRGRGIVASRIIQRLYEARQQNPQIYILHLLRSPKPQGHRYGSAQRSVRNHFEFQPFNWPKACWGGTLRVALEQADDATRRELLADWGGTTTADRRDWQAMIDQGLGQGWYRIEFGDVVRVERDPVQQVTLTTLQTRNFKGETTLAADFVIDATGLEADVSVSPLLHDLVETYQLPLNPLGRLAVSSAFELTALRSPPDRPYAGRVYAAGAMTLGGPYAAVDSFLGLQYAALWAVQDLRRSHPEIRALTGLRSLGQWGKWVFNQPPD